MESSSYPFEAIRIHNRLDMEIDIDLCSIHIEDELILVVRANERYHRSTIEKNIEHIAFQLKQRYAPTSTTLSIVEYVDRHIKAGQSPKWRQWRFKWIGNSPMNANHHGLSKPMVNHVHHAMLNKQEILQQAS
ncbi:hypothetical protein ACVBE9_03710 [Eionea flava]